MTIRRRLQQQLDRLIDHSAQEDAAESRRQRDEDTTRTLREQAVARAQPRARAAARALFRWLCGVEGTALRDRMRAGGVLRMQLAQLAPDVGRAWLVVESSTTPTLRVESVASPLGGPWYTAKSPKELLHPPENRRVFGCEALVVAAAESLELPFEHGR